MTTLDVPNLLKHKIGIIAMSNAQQAMCAVADGEFSIARELLEIVESVAQPRLRTQPEATQFRVLAILAELRNLLETLIKAVDV
jgi:hypothetical protein